MSNYGRHDYRDPAREKFGKPAISYPDGSLLHPTLTEVFDHRKDSTTGALPYLSLSQNPRAQGCYLTRQSLAKGDDDSTNVNVIYDRLPGVVKTNYPIDETYGIRMKVQTQVIIAVENPPWIGPRFSSEFTLTGQPTPGDTVTVGAITYTFVTALSNPGVANEVLVGGTMAATLYNLASAINQDWGEGVNFGEGTSANSNAVAWFSLNVLVVADTNLPSATFATTRSCANGSWPDTTAKTMLYIEEREIDVNRVHRISSRILKPLPPTVTYALGHEISLPDTLHSAAMVWDESISQGGATQDRNAYGGARAEASAAHYTDGGLALQLVNGFRGMAQATYTRTFSLTPPQAMDIPTPTRILPSLGTLVVRSVGQSLQESVGDAGCSFGASGRVQIKTQQIGPVLTNGITLSGTSRNGVAVTLVTSGSGYTTPPIIGFTGGTGTGATATAVINIVTGELTEIMVTNPGNYSVAPTGITITGGRGLTALNVTAAGTNYTQATVSVAITGGGGTGAAATATVNDMTGEVTGLTITNPGTGYSSAPTVTINDSAVTALDLTAPGTGYTQATVSVAITGGGGTGATATATVDDMSGEVTSLNITNPGSGYTSAPTVTINDSASGTGATATASIASGATATATIGTAATATASLVQIDSGTGDFTPPDVSAIALSPDGDQIYPAAQVSAHAESHAQLAMPISQPAAFNSNDRIIAGVSVQQLRLGLFMIETLEVTVP